ncbi:creatininase family protein [candidate division KSB1 bacterium]|nr:creatininase family protein [candidate division KSB1 bacterium]
MSTNRFTFNLFIIIIILCVVFPVIAQENPDPNRFQKEIEQFQAWDRKNAIPEDYVLMVGSSSIRMWQSMESFPDLKIVNRGFGGAHISDLIHFKHEILLKYKAAQCIVLYCGGNDVTGGKSAERVASDFETFWNIVQRHSLNTPLIYIPAKPCPARWHLWDEEAKLNAIIQEWCQKDPWLYYADTATPMLETGTPPDSSLFIKDLLHMSEKGYDMWTSVVRPLVDKGIRQHAEANLVLYEELTPTAFRKRIQEAPIAYVPLGTLEWHGEHLPLGSDGLQVKHFFEILASEAGGIVLPMHYLGPDRKKKMDGKELYGMDLGSMHWEEGHKYADQQFAGSAYWISEKDFNKILEATWKQLSRAGFKIIVAHGHGPSTGFASDRFGEWEKKYGMKFFHCWGHRDDEGLGIMVDHAGMNETSLVMALRPELVHMEYLPADTTHWPLGLGGKDPRIHASSELGWKAITIQKDRMVKMLREALAEFEY